MPEGFGEDNIVEERTKSVKLHYNNASIGFQDGYKKDAIVTRGDITMELFDAQNQFDEITKYYFELY